MSRAGYCDDGEGQWALIRWRGAVASSIRGKRGQAFLLELIAALDTLPEKALIANDLQSGDNVCAIGSVGVQRGVDMSEIDPHDYSALSGVFGIAEPLVREIEYMNDEGNRGLSDAGRWQHMRRWAVENLTADSLAKLVQS